MYYDRFDIAAAYYHFCWTLKFFRGMPYEFNEVVKYSANKAVQLIRIKYEPGLSDSNLATISPNAKAIYMNLVRKHLGVHSTANK